MSVPGAAEARTRSLASAGLQLLQRASDQLPRRDPLSRREAWLGAAGLVDAVADGDDEVQAGSRLGWLDIGVQLLDDALGALGPDAQAGEQLQLPFGRIPGEGIVLGHGVAVGLDHALFALLGQEAGGRLG